MESLLITVRELIVRSVPTFILFAILFVYLRTALFAPLERVLAERKAATEGTREAAAHALDRAESKAAEYEQKLRAARAGLYKEQEALRNRLRADQAAQLAASREKIGWKLKEAASSIERNKTEAIARLQPESEILAEQITARILRGQAA